MSSSHSHHSAATVILSSLLLLSFFCRLISCLDPDSGFNGSLYSDLKTEYKSFFAQIRGNCPGQPSDSSTSFNFAIPKHKLEEFLTEDFLTEDFPDFVQDRLQQLKVDQSDVTISEPFLKIFATDDGMEGFRVGHVVFKSSFDGTDFHILLRVASVRSSECRLDQQSRDSLTLKAKDLQTVLERKVVESRTFAENLGSTFENHGPFFQRKGTREEEEARSN
jgi:hypothetical protein